MAAYLSFSLEATESSPWFRRLGQGQTKIVLGGTWAGSVTVERLGPDGTAYAYRDAGGSIVAFTAAPGIFELADVGATRVTFTRTSGTVTALVWSDQSPMDILADSENLSGESGLAWMNGDYFQFMAAA